MSLLLVYCHLFKYIQNNFFNLFLSVTFPIKVWAGGSSNFCEETENPTLSLPPGFLMVCRPISIFKPSVLDVSFQHGRTLSWLPHCVLKNVGGGIDDNRIFFVGHVCSFSVQSHFSKGDFVRIFSDDCFCERFFLFLYFWVIKVLIPSLGFWCGGADDSK